MGLGIVLKTVEKCNINCTYCYFFNGLDSSFKNRPIFINEQTVKFLAKFIDTGIKDCDVTEVSIGLHGGEPLMQPKNDFIDLIVELSKISVPIDLIYRLMLH